MSEPAAKWLTTDILNQPGKKFLQKSLFLPQPVGKDFASLPDFFLLQK
jgi:hypothetical protein